MQEGLAYGRVMVSGSPVKQHVRVDVLELGGGATDPPDNGLEEMSDPFNEPADSRPHGTLDGVACMVA